MRSAKILVSGAGLLAGATGLAAWLSRPPWLPPSWQVLCVAAMPGISRVQVAAVDSALARLYRLPVAVLPAPAGPLPDSTRCPVRHRYRARAVLHTLAASLPVVPGVRTKTLLLTTADIELENPPAQPHWGVFGLANGVGGNEAVASTFRLGGRRDRLVKVAAHEAGHLLHLPHCTSGTPTCLMRAAAGRVATVDAEALALCPACRQQLRF